MNGERHHSWQKLKFLKQAYKKNEKFEWGGNTMDVLNASKFVSEDPEAFQKHYNSEMVHLTESLNSQKKHLTDVFMKSLFRAADKRQMDYALKKPPSGRTSSLNLSSKGALSKLGKSLLSDKVCRQMN